MPDKKNSLFDEFPLITTQKWIDKITVDLKGKSLDSINWSPEDGIDLKPFYREEDIPEGGGSLLNKSEKGWQISEYLDLSKEVTAHKKLNTELIDALQFGLQCAILNIDRELSEKELTVLFRDVKLSLIHLFLCGSYPEMFPEMMMKQLQQEIKRKGLNKEDCLGGLMLDPVGYFVESGEFYTSMEEDFMALEKSFSFIQKHLPGFKLIDINSGFLFSQGSTVSQQLAIAMATASEYFAYFQDKSVDLSELAKRIMFTFTIGDNYFLEMSKIRAVRTLWRHLISAYGIKEDIRATIHCATSIDQEEQDPYKNMLGATTQSMSAVLGGTDLLTVIPPDKANSGEGFSKRLARNIQHILKEESHFASLPDVAAGSYYIEVLTSELGNKAWEKLQKIEAEGGLLKFIGV